MGEKGPVVIMATRATMGRGASIVRMKGVIVAERTREDIENALIPRTVFLKGPS
jgi:hypothetical protein